MKTVFIGSVSRRERYDVVKIFKQTGRRKVLKRGTTREQAVRTVESYPDNEKSIVVFYNQ